MGKILRLKQNKFLSIILLLGIAFSVITLVTATAPDPGHNFTESSGGVILGDVIYGSGTDTVAALAGNTTATKKFLRQTGTGSASAVPAWDTLATTDIPDISATYSAKAGNTSLVTVGALTAGSLGTGFTAVADAQIFSAATWNAKMTNPMSAVGDIIYGGTSGTPTRLGGSAGFLKSTGVAAPAWSAVNLAADVSTSILPVANGGTNLAAAVSDAVLVGDSTSAYTARTLPASCAGTNAKLLYDSTTNLFSCGTDQTGSSGTATQYNQSVAAQGAGFATDTYLTGSSIAIPASSLKVGSRYHLIFNVSKTNAGTATPIVYVRFGTNGSTADTARLTFTFTAGTAAADIGTFDVWITFRTVGASGVMQGVAQLNHRLSTTGLGNMPGTTLPVTSGAFDTTVADSIIGVSVNGGSLAAWTVQMVQAELYNLQ